MSRILIIDPGRHLRATLEARPALAGHVIESAGGTVDALRRLRACGCSVLVTNPASSVEEDLALVAEVRTVRPAVRPIVLAARTTPEDVIAALRAQVFAVFSAPFDMDELAAMVGRAAAAESWHDGIQIVSARPDWLCVRLDFSVLTAERLLRYVTELRLEIPEADREGLLVAYREVLLNALDHGLPSDPSAVVEVAAVRTERSIVFHVKDPGPGFDPGRLPALRASPGDPAVAELLRREETGRRTRGFGVLVARTIVDEMIHNEHANEVLLIKHTG